MANINDLVHHWNKSWLIEHMVDNRVTESKYCVT